MKNMKSSIYKRSLKHKLDLILQKLQIESDLEVYDDGHHYIVYDTQPAEYLPTVDKRGYSMFGGTYGDCVRYLRSLDKRNEPEGKYQILK